MPQTITHQNHSKSRLEWLDLTKGFAMTLVVIGHLIQNRIAAYDENLAFKLIYMFHMPLFFYIAGITCELKKSQPLIKRIQNSSVRLLLPFFIWYLIPPLFSLITSMDIPNVTLLIKQLYEHPDYGLWFLWVLFVYHAINTAANHLKLRYEIHPVITYLVISGLMIAISSQYQDLGIKLIIKHLPYFLAGLIHKRITDVLKNKEAYTFSILTLAFFFMSFIWERNLNNIADNLRQISAISITPDYLLMIIAAAVTLSAAFSGALLTIKITTLLASTKTFIANQIKKCFTLVGKRSIEIYVLHFHLLSIYVLPNNAYLDILMSAILIISACLIFSFLTRQLMPKLTLPLYGYKINQ